MNKVLLYWLRCLLPYGAWHCTLVSPRILCTDESTKVQRCNSYSRVGNASGASGSSGQKGIGNRLKMYVNCIIYIQEHEKHRFWCSTALNMQLWLNLRNRVPYQDFDDLEPKDCPPNPGFWWFQVISKLQKVVNDWRNRFVLLHFFLFGYWRFFNLVKKIIPFNGFLIEWLSRIFDFFIFLLPK